ncbi:DNA-directed RNA polymerase sigma-70 factor [Paenibacillus lautus]|uniref:RNA polymerase sigma factor n=1 Tax=Paenibacillus lautus TaxID=1401 RepID=UPI001B14A5AA|nr:sigma-70 family RNA polymerase sigma factor [Paenibacillus lautus]GIO99548.1 DNA-directed RNA polymerase sigma-70 factor [Paenibacillus lautus]
MHQEIDRKRAEEVFNQYSTYVFRIALLLTKSASLADDVTQETFLKVFKNIHNYDCTKPMQPWIYRITVNTTRNLLRKHKWLSFVGFTPDVQREFTSVEDSIIQSVENEELLKEVNMLPLKGREVIVLHYYVGLKLAEIAETLQIPLGTCKSRLNAALKILRKQLPHNEMFSSLKGGEMV